MTTETVTVTRRHRFTVKIMDGEGNIIYKRTRLSAAGALDVVASRSNTMRATGCRMHILVRGVVVSSKRGGMGPSIDPMVCADMRRLADEGGNETFVAIW